jgi:small basic protein (TIGR04137 family)
LRFAKGCAQRGAFQILEDFGRAAGLRIAKRVSMTIDKSLKVKAGAIKNRNVLTRAERIAKLLEADRWKEGDKVLGLPKVRVMKLALKKKKKAKAEVGAEGAAAPAAGAAAPAAGAKPAAGAAAAKPAAKPAAKK